MTMIHQQPSAVALSFKISLPSEALRKYEEIIGFGVIVLQKLYNLLDTTYQEFLKYRTLLSGSDHSVRGIF